MARLALIFTLVASLTAPAFADDIDVGSSVSVIDLPVPLSPDEPAVQVDRAQLRDRLAANRAANLAHFRAYQRRGEFPSNTYTERKLHVWLDEDGHLCAAATIIKASGDGDLVASVAVDDNFIRLADVTDGPLLDWILTSGFTQDELDAIQEPMMPVSLDPGSDRPLVHRGLRRAETRRLVARYRQVDKQLVRDRGSSLDAAVERLMANPTAARAFLGRVDG